MSTTTANRIADELVKLDEETFGSIIAGLHNQCSRFADLSAFDCPICCLVRELYVARAIDWHKPDKTIEATLTIAKAREKTR